MKISSALHGGEADDVFVADDLGAVRLAARDAHTVARSEDEALAAHRDRKTSREHTVDLVDVVRVRLEDGPWTVHRLPNTRAQTRA
jgi:hypothetical protein